MDKRIQTDSCEHYNLGEYSVQFEVITMKSPPPVFSMFDISSGQVSVMQTVFTQAVITQKAAIM